MSVSWVQYKLTYLFTCICSELWLKCGWDLRGEYMWSMLVGLQKIVDGSFIPKGWLSISSQMWVKRLCRFKKIFNSSVKIMLIMMRMLNYPLLFLCPHDNCFKEEEILLHLHYYLNFRAILYYMSSEVGGWTFSYIFQHFLILQASITMGIFVIL
jgi:hypothetical protein